MLWLAFFSSAVGVLTICVSMSYVLIPGKTVPNQVGLESSKPLHDVRAACGSDDTRGGGGDTSGPASSASRADVEEREDGKMAALSPDDPSSFSRPDLCPVTNVHLSWSVNFEKRVLNGYVDLTVKPKGPDVSSLILDTRDLTIRAVNEEESGEELSFKLGTPLPPFGSKLEIQLPSNPKSEHQIRILYETSCNSSALQWLPPEQTAGQKHPYMFSQCQAIHARSLLPCQDTPSVKTPFTASVSAPKEMVVLMGALRTKMTSTNPTRIVYHFKQPVPVPSYLIAIVIGALESRPLGPRSTVWSEKELVDKAAYEFAETEDMLKAGEEIMGPYIWTQYDILMLPPSFPFGGMENPCLTFVTPTLLAGDRSLANVVAHEIAHSWTGNLVTNKNFEHFWLNEGFTVFVERKIVGRMKGENQRHFQAIVGWKELKDAISNLGKENPLTKLVLNLTGVDPDDAFSVVPYEKGHSLLFYLEQIVGGAGKFDNFLRAYVDTFKYRSIDTDQWKAFLLDYFDDDDARAVFDDVDWNSWLHKPGMPPVTLEFNTQLAEDCTKLSDRWKSTENFKSFQAADIQNMTSMQICEFLNLLSESDHVSLAKLKALQDVYNFHSTSNSEIKFRWFRLCIKGRWPDVVPLALKFVSEQGRMKFVRPIYRDLYAWEDMRQQAISNYLAQQPQMMYVSASMVSKDLHLKSDSLTQQ